MDLSTLSNRYGIFDHIIPVSGGCINNGCCLVAGEKKYFLKWNNAHRFPGMFEAEARGLELLHNANTLVIPRVLETGITGDESWILMEWIEASRPAKNFWYEFGAGLARMHRHTHERFGLDHDNYIGSLPQSNSMQEDWSGFFFHQRLEPQARQAVDHGALPASLIKGIETLHKKLPELVPIESPALIHGDLWNGNYLVGPTGSAALIDPAVYYGHREMDLAMTRLFGGFDERFYQGYDDTFPLARGFEHRVDVHNLYPLLVHVNLFGGGYIQQVKSILSKYV